MSSSSRYLTLPLLRTLSVNVLLLILIAHVPQAHAQAGTPTPSPSPSNLPKYAKIKEEDANRHFLQSKDAPLTNVLTSNNELKSSFNKLLKFIQHIDDSVVYATTQTSASINQGREDEEDKTTEDTLTTCNHRDDGWVSDISIYFHVRGWLVPDTSCTSDVYGTDKKDGVVNQAYLKRGETPLSPSQLFDSVWQHSDLVNGKAVLAAREAQITNWTDSTGKEAATRARNFTHEVRSQTCQYDYMGFVKFNKNWYVAERITNRQKDIVLEVGARNFLYEYIRPDDSPKTMRLRSADRSFEYQNDATTAIGYFTGIVTASAFGTIFPTDNLAVQDALRIGEHQTQQADDATTTSNIAILAFPLVMNVVPVALIADVNSLGMLVYTLMTDVLTAVPLAIKGVEVLTIGRRSNSAAVTRITGANLNETSTDGTPVLKAAEVWVARCRATGSLTAIGVTLLMVAITFMIGGVAAEFWAKHWVMRKGAGKVIDENWGNNNNIEAANEFMLEPVSSTTAATAPPAHTPPNNATAALLAGGVRERERFLNAGTQQQGIPGTGTADPTPPTSMHSEGVGSKPKET